MANGEFIKEASHESLRGIELADRFFGSAIEGILADKAVCANETGHAGTRRVGVREVLRYGVGNQEAQSPGKAFLQPQLHRVIRGVARAIRSEGVIFLFKVAVLREGSKGLVDLPRKGGIGQFDTSRNRIRTGIVCQAGNIHGQFTTKREERRIHLIGNNVQGRQVSAFGADVGHAYDQVRGDLALYVQIPSLDVGRASAVSRHEDDPTIRLPRAAILRFGRQGSKIRKNTRHTSINLEAARRGQTLPIEKSQAVLVGKRSLFQWLVEDAITSAKHCLVVDAVSEAYARAECFFVGILRTLPSIAV